MLEQAQHKYTGREVKKSQIKNYYHLRSNMRLDLRSNMRLDLRSNMRIDLKSNMRLDLRSNMRIDLSWLAVNNIVLFMMSIF